MTRANMWVKGKRRRRKAKMRKSKAYRKQTRLHIAPNSKATSIQYSPSVSNQRINPSLLETITSISEQIDLSKIRQQLAQVNEIVHQVSGVIQQINQWGRPTQSPYQHHPYTSNHVNQRVEPILPQRNGSNYK